MGMIANFLRIGQEELNSYLEDSSLLENRIYGEGNEDDPNLLDIDKSWDGIIYLLTGKGVQEADYSDPSGLHRIIFSGQLVDADQDLGYGPAHYLTPDQVTDLNALLSKESRESLYGRYNPSGMEQVYPDIWDEGDEAFEYLYVHFVELQGFYSQATKENQAIITFIN